MWLASWVVGAWSGGCVGWWVREVVGCLAQVCIVCQLMKELWCDGLVGDGVVR